MTSLTDAAHAGLKGIIIFGSAASVNDRAPWQEALETWIRPYLMRGVPTLGICYGHQMLAYMFGGRVDYAFADRKTLVGFRSIEISAATQKNSTPWIPRTGLVATSHNETVTVVPPVMDVIATSSEISTDGLRHRDLPIFSFQSHPEATRAFLRGHAIADEPAKLSFGQEIMRDFLAFAAQR